MTPNSNLQLAGVLVRRRRRDVASEFSPMAAKTVPMDVFKWIVSGLLSVLVVGLGWFLSEIRAELRDVNKQVAGIRVEAAVTATKLDNLIDELRRRSPR